MLGCVIIVNFGVMMVMFLMKCELGNVFSGGSLVNLMLSVCSVL